LQRDRAREVAAPRAHESQERQRVCHLAALLVRDPQRLDAGGHLALGRLHLSQVERRDARVAARDRGRRRVRSVLGFARREQLQPETTADRVLLRRERHARGGLAL
jgi:hypothetical protein